MQQGSRRQVPDPGGLVVGPRGQQRAVRTEAHGGDRVPVAREGVEKVSARQVPQLRLAP